MKDYTNEVRQSFRQFLDSTGHKDLSFSDKSNLVRDLGLKSDEGIDFVLELCDQLDSDFPEDFNPFVHKSGRRGNTFTEMVDAVNGFKASQGVQI